MMDINNLLNLQIAKKKYHFCYVSLHIANYLKTLRTKYDAGYQDSEVLLSKNIINYILWEKPY